MISEIGKVFGELTVLRKVASCKAGHANYECLCSCGNTKVIGASNLRTGNTKSCGCQKTKNTKTHGMKKSTTYNSWRSMIQRCANPNDTNYRHYGGRGIKVCEAWAKSFESFYADMGDRPYLRTLDRIEVNGHYEKSNCRWATLSEQARNKRPKLPPPAPIRN